ncbi:hypothetical protein CBL_14535 [Carabus blaptoides fortunei]
MLLVGSALFVIKWGKHDVTTGKIASASAIPFVVKAEAGLEPYRTLKMDGRFLDCLLLFSDKMAYQMNRHVGYRCLNGIWIITSSYINIIKDGDQLTNSNYHQLNWNKDGLKSTQIFIFIRKFIGLMQMFTQIDVLCSATIFGPCASSSFGIDPWWRKYNFGLEINW